MLSSSHPKNEPQHECRNSKMRMYVELNKWMHERIVMKQNERKERATSRHHMPYSMNVNHDVNSGMNHTTIQKNIHQG